MLVLQEVLLINMDIRFAEAEYLIPLKKTMANIMMLLYFWASGACFFIRSEVFNELEWI